MILKRSRSLCTTLISALVGTACGGAGVDTPHQLRDAPPAALAKPPAQAAVVGTPFNLDATLGDSAFSNPRGGALRYTVVFAPSANGLVAMNGRISGIPSQPEIVSVALTATDIAGATATESFPIVAFAAGLGSPQLPASSFAYTDAEVPLPVDFFTGNIATVVGADNTPPDNAITNAGATLGRVLFYDTRLSVNDGTACASCHQQRFGFSDTARFSRGFSGGRTARHAMGLANARFYQDGRFFWDERAPSLEAQTLQPIQNATEMGMNLDDLVLKLTVTNYYPALFKAAFGTPEVTTDRVSRALAQFVRTLVSGESRFDSVFIGGGAPNFARLSAQENDGHNLFIGAAKCTACHRTNAMFTDAPRNTGLDSLITDAGTGDGRFKAPSLRNIAVRGPYMHDGRFKTLQEVVAFYDSGVQLNPNLDFRLRAADGSPLRLNLTAAQRDAIVAFLASLTDPVFLAAPRLSNPFQNR